mgnify:CR=1 FL=1
MNSNQGKVENYKSILMKVTHKPLIIKNILSLIMKRPYSFLELIEKDEHLKSSLNNLFSSTKKRSDLPHDIKNNLCFLLAYKNFKSNFKINSSENSFLFEEENFGKIDPSITNIIAKYALDQLEKEIKRYIPNPTLPSISGFEEVLFNKFEKSNKLVCLPKMNKNTQMPYNDYFFIENYLLKKSSEPEIEVLYCIIDENKYYNDLDSMYQNIKIEKVYFLYIKSNKKINIYDSIKGYLNKIRTDDLKEIIFGKGFFEEEEIRIPMENDYFYKNRYYYIMPISELIDDILFAKKNPIRIKSLKNIKFAKEYSGKYNIFSKIYLGLSLLFCNTKIEGIKIVDIRSFIGSDFKIEKNEKKLLILKVHNLSLFEEKKYRLRIYDLIGQYNYLVIYFSEEIAKYKYSKKIFFDLSRKHFLFYTEVPTKAINFNIDLYNGNYLIEDDKNNIILLNNMWCTEKEILFPYYRFLIFKYKVIRYTLGSKYFFIFSGNNIVYGLYEDYGYKELVNILNLCIKFMKEKHSKIYNNLFYFINDKYTISNLDSEILLIKDIDKDIKNLSIISNFKVNNLRKNIDNIEIRYINHLNCSPNDTQQILDLIFKKKERKNYIKSSKKKNFFKVEIDTEDELETSDDIFEEEDYYLDTVDTWNEGDLVSVIVKPESIHLTLKGDISKYEVE